MCDNNILDLSGETVMIVSDIHLGWEASDTELFYRELEKVADANGPVSLILLGDIFDFWRRPDKVYMYHLAEEFFDHLKEDDKTRKIFYGFCLWRNSYH